MARFIAWPFIAIEAVGLFVIWLIYQAALLAAWFWHVARSVRR